MESEFIDTPLTNKPLNRPKSSFIQKTASFFFRKPPIQPEEEEEEEEKPIEAKNYDDLPKDLQKLLKSAKISKSEVNSNVELILNILQFVKKVKLRYHDSNHSLNRNDVHSTDLNNQTESILDSVQLILAPLNPSNLYELISQEGKGGFGRVYKASKTKGSHSHVAIKRMRHVSKKEKRTNINEARSLRFCDHPNIVKFVDAFLCQDELWLVMEYMEGGTLSQAASSVQFSESQIAYMAREILKALTYLHSLNLCHRDLKSSNIMMTINGEVKLVDFGLCVDLSKPARKSMVGSPYWMSPEMIQGTTYDCKIDVWSFGVCLCELANGHPPSFKSSLQALYLVATQGIKRPIEKQKMWSSHFLNFVGSCLTFDPEKRPSAEKLLQHSFLNECASPKSMKKVLNGVFVLDAVVPF